MGLSSGTRTWVFLVVLGGPQQTLGFSVSAGSYLSSERGYNSLYPGSSTQNAPPTPAEFLRAAEADWARTREGRTLQAAREDGEVGEAVRAGRGSLVANLAVEQRIFGVADGVADSDDGDGNAVEDPPNKEHEDTREYRRDYLSPGESGKISSHVWRMLGLMRRGYTEENLQKPLSVAYLAGVLGAGEEKHPLLSDAAKGVLGFQLTPGAGELSRMYLAGIISPAHVNERRDRLWEGTHEALKTGTVDRKRRPGEAAPTFSLKAVRKWADGMAKYSTGRNSDPKSVMVVINQGRPPSPGHAEQVVGALLAEYEEKRRRVVRLSRESTAQRDDALLELILALSSKLLFLSPMRAESERVFGVFLVNREMLRARAENPETNL